MNLMCNTCKHLTAFFIYCLGCKNFYESLENYAKVENRYEEIKREVKKNEDHIKLFFKKYPKNNIRRRKKNKIIMINFIQLGENNDR